jgi:hypothetical protein
MTWRGFIVWGAGIVAVLGAFLIFVAVGWPGGPDDCTNIDQTGVQVVTKGQPPDSCYCEHFDVSDAFHGSPGVRQPVNTWFNLYAIFTSLIVAFQVWRDRENGGAGENAMKQRSSPLADAYIFAVLFLGLGSMWFHGSLSSGISWMDGFSMYVFAGFLVFYTIHRFCRSGKVIGIIPRDWFFWIGYPLTAVGFTILGQVIGHQNPHAPVSTILIVILVAVYLLFEILILSIDRPWSSWDKRRITWSVTVWLSALAAFGFACLFRALSETGKILCDAKSFFQPHGLLWHPLAGVMAVLLYYFWREQDDRYQPSSI